MAQNPENYTEQDKLNWEVEKLKREHTHGRWSVLSAIIVTVVALIGTSANIYFHSVQKTLAEIQKEKLELDIRNLKKEQEDLKNNKISLETERDRLQSNLTRIKQELAEIAAQQDTNNRKQLEKLADEIQIDSVASTISTTNISARVYLQYLRSKENKILPIIEELQKRGYIVSPKSIDSSQRKRELFVGYYYESDTEEANQLLKLLQKFHPVQLPHQLTRLSGTTRQRHYDVWIAYQSNE